MRWRSSSYLVAAVLLLTISSLWADQIVLKDGTAYSGKFVRGDSNSVEFRILGRTESFKIADIVQIVFKEPELDASVNPRLSKRSPAQPAAPPQDVESFPAKTAQASGNEKPATEVSRPKANPRSTIASQGEPASSASAASGTERTFHEGTSITIRVSSAIDTDRNRVGDVFDATLEQPMMLDNQTIFPRGATVKGRIAYAKESGRFAGQSQLILELTALVANGRIFALKTSDYIETGANRANRTAATVVGTSALGAIVGAIAGGGTGAAVGAASGAAVGTGVQAVTRGQVIKVPAESILEFKLQSPLKID
jgi:hypothetical protein